MLLLSSVNMGVTPEPITGVKQADRVDRLYTSEVPHKSSYWPCNEEVNRLGILSLRFFVSNTVMHIFLMIFYFPASFVLYCVCDDRVDVLD